jgi:hypothetical protein
MTRKSAYVSRALVANAPWTASVLKACMRKMAATIRAKAQEIYDADGRDIRSD